MYIPHHKKNPHKTNLNRTNCICHFRSKQSARITPENNTSHVRHHNKRHRIYHVTKTPSHAPHHNKIIRTKLIQQINSHKTHKTHRKTKTYRTQYTTTRYITCTKHHIESKHTARITPFHKTKHSTKKSTCDKESMSRKQDGNARQTHVRRPVKRKCMGAHDLTFLRAHERAQVCISFMSIRPFMCVRAPTHLHDVCEHTCIHPGKEFMAVN